MFLFVKKDHIITFFSIFLIVVFNKYEWTIIVPNRDRDEKRLKIRLVQNLIKLAISSWSRSQVRSRYAPLTL